MPPRNLKNLNQRDAQNAGWEVLKDLQCEVIGKAVYDHEGLRIMKSTKRFRVESGWLYNTSTEYMFKDRVSVAEALEFVPEIEKVNMVAEPVT